MNRIGEIERRMMIRKIAFRSASVISMVHVCDVTAIVEVVYWLVLCFRWWVHICLHMKHCLSRPMLREKAQ